MTLFICEVCGNVYYYRKSLKRHISTVHPQQLNDIMPPHKNKKPFCYQCFLCDKRFVYKISLNRHQRFVHGQIPKKLKNRLKCILCAFETTSKKCLHDHLQSTHEIHLKSEDLQFSSEVEFLQWKEDMERSTHSKFVRIQGSMFVGDCSRRYYVCHRSGRFISKSKGIRRLKKTGSVKINGKCPAEIKVVCKEGTYRVHFVPTHVGHNLLHEVGLTSNSNPPESLSDVNASSYPPESLAGVNPTSKTPESLSKEKHKIISVFSDIVNGLTGSEIQLAESMVTSLKEKICAARSQNSRASTLKSPERSRKKKLAKKSRIYTTKDVKSSCHISSVVTDVEDTRDLLRLFTDEGLSNICSATVEEDNATLWQQELKCSSTGPFSVIVEHDDDMPWKQELELSTPGHSSIAVKKDDTPWQQELQNCTPGPISVAVEKDDVMPWHQELQNSIQGLDTNHYVATEHSYSAPCNLVKEPSTAICTVLAGKL